MRWSLIGMILVLFGCGKVQRGADIEVSPHQESAVGALSLLVYIPDHPEQNPTHFRIGKDDVTLGKFESELRSRLLSHQYSKIQVATGKVGNDHFEALVAKVAHDFGILTETLPAPRSNFYTAPSE
jgi:hypothetical protein